MNIRLDLTLKQATGLQQGLTTLAAGKFSPAVGQQIMLNLQWLARFIQLHQDPLDTIAHEIGLMSFTIEDLNLGQNRIPQMVLMQIQPLLKPAPPPSKPPTS